MMNVHVCVFPVCVFVYAYVYMHVQVVRIDLNSYSILLGVKLLLEAVQSTEQ